MSSLLSYVNILTHNLVDWDLGMVFSLRATTIHMTTFFLCTYTPLPEVAGNSKHQASGSGIRSPSLVNAK